MNTQINLDKFHAQLTKEYEILFETPDFDYARKITSPPSLSLKMTLGLDQGTANKDGVGIKRACKHFGVKHTYKAIRAFLNEC